MLNDFGTLITLLSQIIAIATDINLTFVSSKVYMWRVSCNLHELIRKQYEQTKDARILARVVQVQMETEQKVLLRIENEEPALTCAAAKVN